MEKLAACPFCGHQPQFSRIPGQGFSILCQGCGAIAVLAGSGRQQDLARGWNRRTVRHNLSVQSQLAPCPFCASRQLAKGGDGGAIIQCQSCGMMVSFVHADDARGALRRWNARTRADAP